MKTFNEKLNLDKNLIQTEAGSLSISPEDIKGISIKNLANQIKEISNSDLNKEDKIKQLSQFVKELQRKIKESQRKEDLYKKHQDFLKGLSPQIHNHFLKLIEQEKIMLFEMTIGEKNKDQIQQELDERIKITDHNDPNQISEISSAQKLLDNPTFKISSEKKEIKLIKLSVADLGFPNGATFKKIIKEGEKLGLTICPPEVGPLLRLSYEEFMGHDQPKDEYIAIAMKPIVDGRNPRVFSVFRFGNGARFFSSSWPVNRDSFTPHLYFLFVRK